MKTFYAEHGRFPTSSKNEDSPLAKKTAGWLGRQRAMFKEYDSLSEKEQERLDMLRAYLVSISTK
jgi:hypothetical protein